jgi:tetratricopeptide (TPR) repeat protein
VAAEKAKSLEPDLPEAQLALGYYYYRCVRDYVRALPYLEKALVALPGNAEVIYAFASVERRQGRWGDAARNFRIAAAARPSDPIYQFNAVTTLLGLRRFDEAWQILEPVLRRMPSEPPLRLAKSDLFLAWKEDLGPMREFVNSPSPAMPPEMTLGIKIDLLLLEAKFDEALEVLKNSDSKVEAGQARYRTRNGWETEILAQAGRWKEAKFAAERAVLELAPLIELQPDDARYRMAYALALASTGEAADQAVREATTAASLISVEKDAFDGPFYLEELALVYLRTGHLKEAAEIVLRLQKIPSLCYDARFRISPAWAALRPELAKPRPATP